jgi:hypothetical protein
MTRWKFWWLVLGVLLLVPYAILFITGSIWLYEYGMLWWYLAISVVLTLVSSAVMHWMRLYAARRDAVEGSQTAALGLPSGGGPDPHWPPLAKKAWDEVESIARRVQAEDLPLDQPDRIWQVFHEVLQNVARQYHPESSQPELETPAPQVFWTVERVARDLREAFSENIPGAHIFTLGDFWRLKRVREWYRQFYFLYRIVSIGWNPISALFREARDAATDKMLVTSTGDVKQWAVGFCVRRTGFYAIQLYSGQQEWDEAGLQAFRTPESRRDARRAAASEGPLTEEPLRILIAGQVKSGKSSAINALFGEPRAAVDVVPRTRCIEPYVLERDGMPQAILLDTVGYEAADAPRDPFTPLEEEILRCDLVLVVCTALSAARQADRRLLDQLRAFYQRHPERPMPPVVAVVTHIDQLRPPGEWSPPYDLAHPSGIKATNIADALQAVEQDLGLGENEPVVPVCLKPGAEYNVEEGLAPAILQVLPAARAARYLRCLRTFRKATQWRRLWRQTRGAGRVLWKAGKTWLGRRKV